MNPNIPEKCRACDKPLLLENLFVDDGCPCNSPRGVNFWPRTCGTCGTDNCVKPGHRLLDLFGSAAVTTKSRIKEGPGYLGHSPITCAGCGAERPMNPSPEYWGSSCCMCSKILCGPCSREDYAKTGLDLRYAGCVECRQA